MALSMQFDQQTDDLIFGGESYFPEITNLVKGSGETAKAKIDAVVEFTDWLQKSFPEIYAQVAQARPDLIMPEFAMAGLSGLGEGETPTPSTDWGKMFSDFVTPIVGVWSQKQLIDINIKRAENGQEPLRDISSLSPSVNVNLPYETQRQIGEIGKVLTIGLIGLGALFLISRKRR